MTQFLPPNLLALFAARDPIPYLPPVEKLPHEKDSKPYSGISEFVKHFEDPKDTPAPTRVETKEERKERKMKERAEQTAYKLEQDLALWDPSNDDNIHGDPFKTLFVARINYDTSESKLRREFEQYGSIRRIHMITNRQNNKPRGYTFIEYNHERDMHAAYKHADGKKIDSRRVLVDVEMGRTVKGWRPRRLGGGLGSTRKGGQDECTKYSGRDEEGEGKERPIFEDRERREPSRDRRRSRRDRSKSRDKDRERKRSRDKKVKKEEGGGRKRSRRSRSRDRSHRSRSKGEKRRIKRSSSRSRVKREKVKKEEPVGDGYGDYEGDYPVKKEKERQSDYYNDQYNNQMPPLPSGDRAN